jgi:hypothetical protein
MITNICDKCYNCVKYNTRYQGLINQDILFFIIIEIFL